MTVINLIQRIYSTVISRELTFMLMLGSSFLISMVLRLLGHFRYKKEVMSIVGVFQLVFFCNWDALHFLVMILVGTILIKVDVFGPKAVFVYCMLHRILFSSSSFLGLTRDESNLANAGLFISTLKMIIVAYEISDYRRLKKDEELKRKPSIKWVDIEDEPSSYDIICFMTCYAALFTGPVFRYKTYNDMFSKYLNVPIREELIKKLKECAILSVLLCCSPYYVNVYSDGSFYQHKFLMRMIIMAIVAVTQGIKYTLAWLLSESSCLLIGLGAYPASSKPIVVMGPSVTPPLTDDKELTKENDFSFETISNINFYTTLSSGTIKEAMQTWNKSVQWWLAYFIFANPVFPRSWKLVRTLSVVLVSAILHGTKLGYFMSFPVIVVCLAAEKVWNSIEARITWNKVLIFAYRTFYFIFIKMSVLFYIITIFILQDKEKIFRFCMSTFYYGYLVPVIYLFSGLVIKYTLPRNTAEI